MILSIKYPSNWENRKIGVNLAELIVKPVTRKKVEQEISPVNLSKMSYLSVNDDDVVGVLLPFW